MRLKLGTEVGANFMSNPLEAMRRTQAESGSQSQGSPYEVVARLVVPRIEIAHADKFELDLSDEEEQDIQE